jgi:hypothetical protein
MKNKNVDYMPDQKLHRNISFIKSGIRIIGCITLMYSISYGAGLLALAEGVGILEEMV